MKAVILATKGRESKKPNAFLKLCGVSLLERNLCLLKSLGINDIFIFSKTPVKDSLQGNVVYFDPMEISSKLKEDFLVISGRNLLDKRIIEELLKRRGLAYCIDNSPSSTIKIYQENGIIRRVSEELEDYSGFYVGACRLTPKIFKLKKDFHDFIGLLDEIANNFKVSCLDISEIDPYMPDLRKRMKPSWYEVNRKEDLKVCKRMLIEGAQKGTNDLLATYFNAPIENKIVNHISDSEISPNQVTIITNLVAYLATSLFFYGHLFIASIMTFIVSFLDGVDGKLARVKGISSRVGGMEHPFDFLFEHSWYIALAWFLSSIYGNIILFICIFIVLFDAFTIYVNNQFKKAMKVSLVDFAKFERTFRKFDGRKNSYIIFILLGVASGKSLYALFAILGHAILTAAVYTYRAMKHMHAIDKARTK